MSDAHMLATLELAMLVQAGGMDDVSASHTSNKHLEKALHVHACCFCDSPAPNLLASLKPCSTVSITNATSCRIQHAAGTPASHYTCLSVA